MSEPDNVFISKSSIVIFSSPIAFYMDYLDTSFHITSSGSSRATIFNALFVLSNCEKTFATNAAILFFR